MAPERHEITITRDNGIDSGGQCAGNDMIIVRVTRYDAANGGRFYGVRQRAVIFGEARGCSPDLS